MLTAQIKNEIKYNFIDYKQPVNVIENDLRTSTYLGHRYYKQNDSTMPVPMKSSVISPSYAIKQKEMRYIYASEQAAQYAPKYNFDRTNKANLFMCSSKPTFAKSMEHRIFSRPPKPTRNGSTQSRDYAHTPQSQNDYIIMTPMSCVGKRSGYSDCDDVGGYRYDTTNMNVYQATNGEHIPPGCDKDTITFWNYNQAPKFRSASFPKQKIVGNRSTFLKHNGMKSENQRAFSTPIPRKFDGGDILLR